MDPSLAPLRWTPVASSELPALRAMYEHYVGELVSFGAAYTKDADGVWQPDYFPYWSAPEDFAETLLLRAGEGVAGFAFVGRRPFPYMSAEVDLRVVEFYVVPAYRGCGIAGRAALQLLTARPGSWELSVLIGNDRALKFWRRVVRMEGIHAPQEHVQGLEVLLRFTVAR